MIQRIQTIYLLIAAFLVGSLFFVPFAELANGMGGIYRFDIKGFYLIGAQNSELIFSSLPIAVVGIISILFIIATIFQYNKRARQITFSKLNILILLTLSGLISYYAWRCVQLIAGSFSPKIYLVFPLIAIILIYLAIKGIIKDERLLKSMDRIR